MEEEKRLSLEDFHWEAVSHNDQNHMILEIICSSVFLSKLCTDRHRERFFCLMGLYLNLMPL